MDQILITGGAGFVGSCLAIQLRGLYPKAKILCLDNLKRRGSELNLARLKAANIDFVHGDIRNPGDLDIGMAPDLFIECSAEPSVLAGYGHSPAYLLQTNLVGTINCLEKARQWNSFFVFLSTSRVYSINALSQLPLKSKDSRFSPQLGGTNISGFTDKGISECFTTQGPRSLYGTSKLASEMLIEEYRAAYGLKSVVNRCGVLTGPWQMGKVDQGFAVLWIASHVYNNALRYIGYGGQGHQVRDMLHIEDLFDLIKIQIETPQKVDGKTYNIGGGLVRSASLAEMTKFSEDLTQTRITIQSVQENRPGDIPYYVTDTTLAENELGWRPRHSLESTLADIHQWILENKEVLRPILASS